MNDKPLFRYLVQYSATRQGLVTFVRLRISAELLCEACDDARALAINSPSIAIRFPAKSRQETITEPSSPVMARSSDRSTSDIPPDDSPVNQIQVGGRTRSGATFVPDGTPVATRIIEAAGAEVTNASAEATIDEDFRLGDATVQDLMETTMQYSEQCVPDCKHRNNRDGGEMIRCCLCATWFHLIT